MLNLSSKINYSEYPDVSFREFITKIINKNYVEILFNNLTNITYEIISNIRVLSTPKVNITNCSFSMKNEYNDSNGTYLCNVSSSKTVYGSFAYEICGVSNKTHPIKIYESQYENENILFIKINFWILISFIAIII